jgi:hypothetical protein
MIRVLAGLLIAGGLAGAVDRDMQRAIAWERFKDRAAARQAEKERRHPSVTYDSRDSANRSTEDRKDGRMVKDPGPRQYREDKK